jgi:hypothetical protein
MPLQKLVGNVYSIFVEILLWLIPIVGAVGGYLVIAEFYRRADSFQRFLGILLGILAGFILDVILIGPIIIILNIRASFKNIESKLV